MEFFRKIMVPFRNRWVRVARRLGLQKTGLVKLRHDVRACEYEDVHVLWELLNGNKSDVAKSDKKSGKGRFSRIIGWAKHAPMLCHHGM